MKYLAKYFLISLFIMGLWGLSSVGAEIGQEFHIYKDGMVHMVEAEVFKKHALNFIRVKVWDQLWGVMIDYATTFESAYGEKISLEEIQLGHRLEIKGRPVPGEAGTIEALYIRDLSLKTGTPPAEPQTVSVAPTPATLPAPAPSPTLSLATSAAPKKITQQLSLGIRGEEVVILQEFLQKYGWGIPQDGPVTGFFGKVTESALIKFQKANLLDPTGAVGSQVRELVNAVLAGNPGKTVLSPAGASQAVVAESESRVLGSASDLLTQSLYLGMKGGEVIILQEFLQKYDWGIPNDGPVTGYFGTVTEQTVKKFQLSNGLEAVGSVGPKTRELINTLLSK